MVFLQPVATTLAAGNGGPAKVQNGSAAEINNHNAGDACDFENEKYT